MGKVKVLARYWDLMINTGTTDLPTWTKIKGLNTMTFGNGKNDAETTTFESDGDEEHVVASRNKSLSIEGYHLEDVETGDRDEGQLAIETLAEKVGQESLGDFKRVSPGGNEKYFKASANLSDVGGGNDDPTSWGAEITVSGKLYDAYPMV